MINRNRLVCGELFEKSFRASVGPEPTLENVKIWHRAFATGQAEKIYLGACHGAMFRVGPEWFTACVTIDLEVAKIYLLEFTTINGELWLMDEVGYDLIRKMLECPINSPEWHLTRAAICGIPTDKIDIFYHHRKGYLNKAD